MTNLPPVDRRAFLRLTALGAGSLAITPCLSAAEPLTAVPRSRLDRLATGANVCQWFRFPPRGNSAEHFTDYISEVEAAFMARLGLKHVRLNAGWRRPHIVVQHWSAKPRQGPANQ
ncbi:MAG: twin-arginine translocation signal domain-containing protein [Thermoguttaceae bacterium]